MTTVDQLLRRANSLGARLWAEGERLELDAPADFPDELIELLREHKTAVLMVLTGNTCTPVGTSLSELLAWASELAERDVVLPEPVSYVEVPLRTVSTRRVSWYVAHYLKTISAARLYQENPELCWRPRTREWWKEREDEALGALASLRKALGGCQNDVS
jgi:hypothetical protein